MGGGEMHKLVLTMVFSGACSESAIQADLNSVGISECLQPLWTWEPLDVILLSTGAILTWSSLRSLFSNKRSPNKAERRGKIFQRFGILAALVGIADFFGMLTDDGQPLDAGELLGFPLIGGMSLILLTVALVLSLVGGSLRRKGQSRADTHGSGSRKFIGPAERHLGGDFTVGELRRALMLDAFEDPFQVSADEDLGDSVGRTCHYCNGAGCNQCDFSGTLG